MSIREDLIAIGVAESTWAVAMRISLKRQPVYLFTSTAAKQRSLDGDCRRACTKNSFSFLLPAALLSLAAQVSAHGFLATVTINGKAYNGPKPGQPASASAKSAIRGVSSPDPNKGASNVALTCGPNAINAGLSASANPGDKLTFSWKGADMSNWPHNTGPMLTYMASCGEDTCDKFDDSKAKWFKIDQEGRKTTGNKDWIQQDLMNGGVATGSIPSTLAPGNYLLRHEIIALHLATSMGGAEFYPACIQLTVGGSQSGAPASSDLVSIPGAYKDSDPGIFDPSVFDTNAPYTFPGPKIAGFVSGSPSSGNSSNTGSGSGSGSTGSGSGSGSTGSGSGNTGPSSKPASSTGGTKKSCKIKKTKRSADNTTAPSTDSEDDALLKVREARPYHVSRVMRRMAFGETSR
ncbi:hypothetical protein D9619_012340 [Psilocybe cf. subviscida]|uniref:AA9 family lytic polysaccharide monooxygenase n=1 Tax=Psilocybe cf. subviscida TaxID=2480587 RepID=A0A8H5ARE5_9AGAR|nr:hypothetical protein D9619_012340 [Psilocybe cf. subviscida]